MIINPPLRMPAAKSELLDYSYELYKIDWLISHGLNLTILMRTIADYAGRLDSINTDEFMDDWENEAGFPGAQIWTCKDEFEDCEYNDDKYMAQLLPREVYALYKTREDLPD